MESPRQLQAKTIVREKDKVGDTIAYIKTLLWALVQNYSISQNRQFEE